MNLSVAPSSARRSKRRLATYEAKHQQLADEVFVSNFRRLFTAELERELLPANDGMGRDICELTGGLV